MAHQKFQNVDLQKFQYNEEVAVHLGAIIKHILICTTTVINIFYQKAFLSQVDINIVLLAKKNLVSTQKINGTSNILTF